MIPESNMLNTSRAIVGFQNLLDVIIEQEQEMLDDIKAELKILPKETMCLWRKPDNKGATYFSMRKNGKNYGITSNRELVYKLARKRYLVLSGSEIENNLVINKKIAAEVLKERKRNHKKDNGQKITSLLEDYAKAGLNIARITMTPEQYRWMSSSYPSNEMNPEERVYATYSGILMRSKSERDIGNQLELFGIPYRYEWAVTMDVLWMDDEYGEALYSPKTYYPDFTIMTISGDYIVWEHLGRVDMYKYRSHNMEKICAYRQSGIIDWRHLIITFEQDLLDLETIDDIILKQIIPLGV